MGRHRSPAGICATPAQSSGSFVTTTVAATHTAGAQPALMSARTRLLLEGSIVPTLLHLAWPNILVMLVQSATGLIETWWVSRLGTAALAGMALVFPGF